MAYQDSLNIIAAMHGDNVLQALKVQILNVVEDLDFSDNRRLALPGNAAMVAAYEDSQANGCCGRLDTVFMIEGIEIMFGCNYGH